MVARYKNMEVLYIMAKEWRRVGENPKENIKGDRSLVFNSGNIPHEVEGENYIGKGRAGCWLKQEKIYNNIVSLLRAMKRKTFQNIFNTLLSI
jgi:hypothetical protein